MQDDRKMSKQDHYEVLGIERDATTKQIKKAYRKAALKHHPDRGGDANKFKSISTAYEVLSDPEKKENYDKYGDEEQSGGGGASDIFSMFFGGEGQKKGPKKKKKGKDVKFPLKIPLKEFYTGSTRNIRLKKNIICPQCSGKGGRGVKTCDTCDGKGVRVVVRQLGPGMIQQMQSACGDCNGKGEVIPPGARCSKCRGAKTISTTSVLDVQIVRGMANGEKIVFYGEGEQHPDIIPGNVIVVLQEEKHPTFTRKNNHLFLKKKISLKESLCGFKFLITHLDGRQLLVQSQKGHCYGHGTTKCISDEGLMDSLGRGHLYVEFEVDFKKPDYFSEEQKRRLRSLLPTVPPLTIDRNRESVDEVQLVQVDLAYEKKRFEEEKRRNQYDEDDESQGGGGGTTQCQTQ